MTAYAALTVARAIQRYGMVVRDVSSVPGFFAEDPTPTGSNPYGQIFQGLSPDSDGVEDNFEAFLRLARYQVSATSPNVVDPASNARWMRLAALSSRLSGPL